MLTEYLAPFLKDDPLVLVDIGARWGLDKRWSAFGDSLRAFCFEADAKECDRLNQGGNVTYIPEVISGKIGEATLYETRLDASSGLYQTKHNFFGRLLNSPNADLVGTKRVNTTTLDEARRAYSIPDIDFIKLDIEGAELDVLKATDLNSTFGIYSEIRFHREINGCPTFSDLDKYAVGKGFMLYDLLFTRQSRKALPYRGPLMRWTNGDRFHAYTEHGQVMDGDALYFRDPLLYKLTRNQILKAACMFEVFNLNDCAAELLIAREKDADVDLLHCLDLLAGGSFKTYIESY